MRVVVIGGTGHVGTYLVPRLVDAGHEVVCLSRGKREPYQPHAAWRKVSMVVLDRMEEEARGAFGPRVTELRPDIVVDMVCFTPASARHLVESLRGQVQHFLHCGTIWVHGPSAQVPTTEDQPRQPFGDYGIRKAAIESYLLGEARRGGFPATVLHPGHIVGPGWVPLNPTGNFNPQVYTALARGEEVVLPNLGLETVHHVHADDVAQVFQLAMEHRSTSVGESFDPNRHEAVQRVEGPAGTRPTVVEDFQKGYFLHDRVLRPARVKVMVPAAEKAAGGDGGDAAAGDEARAEG